MRKKTVIVGILIVLFLMQGCVQMPTMPKMDIPVHTAPNTFITPAPAPTPTLDPNLTAVPTTRPKFVYV